MEAKRLGTHPAEHPQLAVVASETPRAEEARGSAASPMAAERRASTWDALRCPACGARLVAAAAALGCADVGCGKRFPIVAGIPVLIDEAKSLFDITDFVERRQTTWPARPRITRLVARLLPPLSLRPRARRHFDLFVAALPPRPSRRRVLVVGGRSLGHGMERLSADETVELVETDVAFGPRTALICDAHDLPFADASFDGAIVQAVLQYVQDPARVADELHRVLTDDGVVYAEVPFVQHGLEGYDFNRFPPLGLRRVFRRFDQIAAGPAMGPATTLNWSVQFFFLSFVRGRIARALTKGAARLAFFWLKRFDHVLISRPGAADAACELFFLGRKSTKTLSDRELVRAVRTFWDHP